MFPFAHAASEAAAPHLPALQTAFYIVGLVYMGLSLLIILGLLVVILKIRSKVVSLENAVKDKLHAVESFGAKAGEVISTVNKLRKRGK